jgi:RhtB (resistance to homoserine/threonine) family protein
MRKRVNLHAAGLRDNGERRVRVLPFLAIAIVVILSPGPDFALVTRNALRFGRRSALLTSLGVCTGLSTWTVAAVLGLAALLRASATAFTVLRIAGAIYLIYLGIQSLLRVTPHPNPPPQGGRDSTSAVRSPFLQGVLNNLLNPKIAVFFTSVLPQFVTVGPQAAGQLAVLGAIFVTIVLVYLCAYAVFAASAADLLLRPSVRRVMDTITGLVLIGFGARLAVERS